MVASTYEVFSFIEEFYKEVTLPRWKPKEGENYYYINSLGEVRISKIFSYGIDKYETLFDFGNCFKTRKKLRLWQRKSRNY